MNFLEQTYSHVQGNTQTAQIIQWALGTLCRTRTYTYKCERARKHGQGGAHISTPVSLSCDMPSHPPSTYICDPITTAAAPCRLSFMLAMSSQRSLRRSYLQTSVYKYVIFSYSSTLAHPVRILCAHTHTAQGNSYGRVPYTYLSHDENTRDPSLPPKA